jgi:uncharacterized protein
VPQHQLIFVNLPVADLARSRAFFTQLGYPFNEDFCDGDALCLRLGPTIHVMLLRQDFFAGLHDRPAAPPGSVETLLCLSAESRESVDALVDRAVLAGGADVRREDHGFMYGRSYSDLDGHVWELMWMDPRAGEGGPHGGVGDTVDLGTGPAGAEYRLEGEMR